MRLITGGSGFLGIALARYLLKKDCDVRVFDKNKSPELPGQVEFIEGDIRDARAVSGACRGMTHLYHLAAMLPRSRAPRSLMREVHLGGLENVLAAAMMHGVSSMVYLSSVEAYGRMAMIPCPEDAPLNPVGEYGRNKAAGEVICRAFFDDRGLHISILRPPTLIGPGIQEPGVFMMMRALKRGGVIPIIGSGRNRVQALDVRDAARAVYICGEKAEAAGRTYNVRCDDTPSMREIVRILIDHADTGARMVRIPARAGVGALRFLDLFGLSPMVADHYELMAEEFIADTTRIKKELGWTPRWTYAESLKEMYGWYRESVDK